MKGPGSGHPHFLWVLFAVQGRLLACSCSFLHDAPGLCWTDASNLLTPILGDAPTQIRLCSLGSGSVHHQKRPEACGYDAKAFYAMGEGPPWTAISCATTGATASVYAAKHPSGNVDHTINLFHGNMNLPLDDFFDAPAVNHLRRHQLKVGQPWFQLVRRQAAFAFRVVGP